MAKHNKNRLMKLTEQDLRGIVSKIVGVVLREEIDLGWDIEARRDKRNQERKERGAVPSHVDKELRRLRNLIDVYDSEGLDTSELKGEIDRLKAKWYRPLDESRKSARLTESYLHRIVKESVNNFLLREVIQPNTDTQQFKGKVL